VSTVSKSEVRLHLQQYGVRPNVSYHPIALCRYANKHFPNEWMGLMWTDTSFITGPSDLHKVTGNSIDSGLIYYDYESPRSLTFFWRLYTWLILCLKSSDCRLNTSESKVKCFELWVWSTCAMSHLEARSSSVHLFLFLVWVEFHCK
jgi:hypothetical protein